MRQNRERRNCWGILGWTDGWSIWGGGSRKNRWMDAQDTPSPIRAPQTLPSISSQRLSAVAGGCRDLGSPRGHGHSGDTSDSDTVGPQKSGAEVHGDLGGHEAGRAVGG